MQIVSPPVEQFKVQLPINNNYMALFDNTASGALVLKVTIIRPGKGKKEKKNKKKTVHLHSP